MTGPVVGFTGLAGSGKSTAAMHLIRRRGFSRVRFAGPLKEMLRALGLHEDHIDGHLKEEPCKLLCGKTPRWAMQTLGNEWGRELIGPDVWVNSWRERVLDEWDGDPIVADDIRYENERDAVRAMGGIVIRVARMGQVSESDHPSETGDFEVDHGIIAASVPVLLDEVDLIVEKYIRDRSWSNTAALPPMMEQRR